MPGKTFHVPAHPGSSGDLVSRRMSGLARRDNDRERAIRSALHARGLRFRVTHKVPGLPRRTIDIAFTRAKVAVFLDGCFWHGCPMHGNSPRSNTDWWAQKIAANRGRDADTTAHLEAAGWRVIRLWEHVKLDAAVEVIASIVCDQLTALRADTAGA
jgi:DNA mismatch endonuclease (patch repair protein)